MTKPSDADQLTAHFLFRGVGHEVRILVVRHHYRYPSGSEVDRSMAEFFSGDAGLPAN